LGEYLTPVEPALSWQNMNLISFRDVPIFFLQLIFNYQVMIPIGKPLTAEEKKLLEVDLRLKPKTFDPLPSFYNPHSTACNQFID
jgi:hypothetical protein